MEPCVKVKYETRATAQVRLNAMADDPRYGPRARFIYHCPHCGWYHLTKQDANYARRQQDKVVFEQQNRIKLEAQHWLQRLTYKRKR